MKPHEKRFIHILDEFVEVDPYITIRLNVGPHKGELRYVPNPDYFHAEYIQEGREYKKRKKYLPRQTSNPKTL